MKYLFLALLVFLAACVPTRGSQTPHTRDALDLETKTIALVMPTSDGSVRAFCSGVWVSSDEIITANHCVADDDLDERVAYVTRGDVSAYDSDEPEAVHMARLTARDEVHDLALLTAKLSPDHGVAELAREVIVGEHVSTMGHPRGLWWSYSEGNVAAVRARDDMADGAMWWVQSTAAISPGNSGGGLFNDDHELLGIAHAYIPRNAENVNLYVHVRYVRALLAKTPHAPPAPLPVLPTPAPQ